MKGMLFSYPLGLWKATLEGTKTETRRLALEGPFSTPRYKVGEKIYLKEPYDLAIGNGGESLEIIYKYDHPNWTNKWSNKLFMGEKFARYFIEITSVRVEQLHDITEEACIREGIIEVTKDGKIKKYCTYDKGDYSSVPWSDMPYTAKEAYQWLWDKINKKKCPWSSNPWVFVYNYKLIK